MPTLLSVIIILKTITLIIDFNLNISHKTEGALVNRMYFMYIFV